MSPIVVIFNAKKVTQGRFMIVPGSKAENNGCLL